jgi:hypothetical protein
MMAKQKNPKQNVQQAFNQFIFDEMMNRLRAIELYEKEVAAYSKQLSQHIADHETFHREIQRVLGVQTANFEELKGQYGGYNFGNRVSVIETFIKCQQTTNDETNEGIRSMLKALPEIEILKTQVRGLEENKAAHIQQSDTIMHMKVQITALEARLPKKPAGRPKKGA